VDLVILKKKISTFKTGKGRLTRMSDELCLEILAAWEQWTGPGNGFYAAIDVDRRKMASLIGRAKRLKRDGGLPESQFKEIKLSEGSVVGFPQGPCSGIEMMWETGKMIRFTEVSQLVDFLKKVA
jgi:hypothetical protein